MFLPIRAAFLIPSVLPAVVLTSGAATSGTVPSDGKIAGLAYFIDSLTFTGTDICGGVSCPATGTGHYLRCSFWSAARVRVPRTIRARRTPDGTLPEPSTLLMRDVR
jgi:hypothetical protein